MTDDLRVEPLGDHAVVVRLGDEITEAAFRQVQAVRARLDIQAPAGTTDIVSGFTTVAVHFDPTRVERSGGTLPVAAMIGAVTALLQELADTPVPQGRLVEVPVCYEGEMAPDLDEVARRAGMSADQVVQLHSAGEYVVQVIGFLPGFPYLGGLDARLATPRRDTPRRRVAAGSVGIGGVHTGIYPIESPGGWNIIGRTGVELFAASRTPAALLAVGDRVRFRPVSAAAMQGTPA